MSDVQITIGGRLPGPLAFRLREALAKIDGMVYIEDGYERITTEDPAFEAACARLQGRPLEVYGVAYHLPEALDLFCQNVGLSHRIFWDGDVDGPPLLMWWTPGMTESAESVTDPADLSGGCIYAYQLEALLSEEGSTAEEKLERVRALVREKNPPEELPPFELDWSREALT